MSQPPDLNLLPLFIAVAESASISATARKLEVPKSSVSRGISALEESLGVQLFHRTTRSLSLTTAGKAFYERARPVVMSLREVTGSLPEQEAEPSGPLRISVPVDMGLTFLPDLIARFSARHPAVQLDVRLSNRIVDLVGEGFDAALRISAKMPDSSHRARRLSALDMGLYAAPSYVARKGQPREPEDTAQHEWVGHTSLKPPPGLGRPATFRVLGDDILFLHRAIRQGLGIGCLPTFVARADVTAGLLVRLLPRWTQRAGSLFFVYPPSEHLPRKVAAFRDFVLAYLREMPLGE